MIVTLGLTVFFASFIECLLICQSISAGPFPQQTVEKGPPAVSQPGSLSQVRCDRPVLRSTEARLIFLARGIGPSRSSQAGGYDSRARLSHFRDFLTGLKTQSRRVCLPGQGEVEGASFAHLAFDPDAPAVHFDDSLGDGEPQPQAGGPELDCP